MASLDMMSDNKDIKDAAALEFKQHKADQKLLRVAKKSKDAKEARELKTHNEA